MKNNFKSLFLDFRSTIRSRYNKNQECTYWYRTVNLCENHSRYIPSRYLYKLQSFYCTFYREYTYY